LSTGEKVLPIEVNVKLVATFSKYTENLSLMENREISTPYYPKVTPFFSSLQPLGVDN
jgi:hypothetical protein